MNRKGNTGSAFGQNKPEPMMRKITSNDRFPCFGCYDHPKDKLTCPQCNGNGWLPGSHPMVQFAEDFIEKRLVGVPTSELSKSLAGQSDFGEIAPAMSRSQDPQKQQRQSFARFFSLVSGQGEDLRLSRKQEEGRELAQQYFCDECSTKQPIRGKRFHCKVCEDYDLCEGCFVRGCHSQHQLQEMHPARRPDNEALLAENKRVNLLRRSIKQR